MAARIKVRGFTLIELIAVLIIVAVLAIAVLPRFADKSIFETRGFHDETKSLLRFAQKSAIAQRRNVCASLDATGVTLTMAGTAGAGQACNSAIALPSTPRGGTGLTSAPVASITFNGLGGTQNAADVTITFSDGSTITVDKVTGHVY